MTHPLARLSVPLLALALLGPVRAAADGPPPQTPPAFNPARSLAPLVDAVVPAVVSIEVAEQRAVASEAPQWLRDHFGLPPGGGHYRDGEGSGFIISPDGLLLTNHHVIANSSKLKVKFHDGSFVNAVLLGSDADLDVALLQLPQDRIWPYLALGSSDNARVGDRVVAVGNGLGLGHTVTTGILSGKARPSQYSGLQEFLQTDAAINPGNSGGPLFDLDGKVVGINTAIISGANTVGFAVPIDLVRGALDDLRTHGRVSRGFMGVATGTVTLALSREQGFDVDKGALVREVYPGTPAATAGLRAGDVIVEVEGREVADNLGLTKAIAFHRPGDAVSLKVMRAGKLLTLRTTLVDREDWMRANAPR